MRVKSESKNKYDDKELYIHSGRRSDRYHGDRETGSTISHVELVNVNVNASDRIQKSDTEPDRAMYPKNNKNREG